MQLGKEQQRLLNLLLARGTMSRTDLKPFGFRKQVFASLTRHRFLEVQHNSWGQRVLLTLDFLRQQGYRAESGLIYQGNRFLNAPEADRLANSVGLVYAERLVEAFNKEQPIQGNP
jgi:hypothetical protein